MYKNMYGVIGKISVTLAETFVSPFLNWEHEHKASMRI